MSNVQAAVRVFITAEASPAEICNNVNRVICGNIASNKFISFFCGVLDKPSGSFTFVNAGHNHPMLVRCDGTLDELSKGGLALGIDPATSYRSGEIGLQGGDRLLLFTDGLTEAADSASNFYGEERLRTMLRRDRALGEADLLERVMKDVRSFAGDSLDDDVTAMLLGRDR